MAHDVFVSYASEDQLTAEAVLASLEHEGIRCWIAYRNLRPGDDYGEHIIEAIKQARVFLLIFSSHANQSRHVRIELERAVSLGVLIIPFRIENVVPAQSLEYGLSSVHWLDALTKPMEGHIRRLIETLQNRLIPTSEQRKPATSPVAAPTTAPRPWWSWLAIASGCFGAVALSAVLFVQFGGRNSPAPGVSAQPPQPATGAQGSGPVPAVTSKPSFDQSPPPEQRSSGRRNATPPPGRSKRVDGWRATERASGSGTQFGERISGRRYPESGHGIGPDRGLLAVLQRASVESPR